jgi:hypothetical protein
VSPHRFPRTERDLRWLAEEFSAGKITRGIPERLECLAAWHRVSIQAEFAVNGQPNSYGREMRAYNAAVERLRQAGVEDPCGELTFSPCCGPDEPWGAS